MDLVQTLSNPELESLLERLVEGIPSRKARARPSPLRLPRRQRMGVIPDLVYTVL
jgi:hypothetical protein